MRVAAALLAILFGCALASSAAEARVAIAVDLASQTMHVTSASGDYDWPISSARSGFNTPRGSYGVQRMEAMHRSHKYHNSPMPHSLFFKGGYAIHGTYDTAALGRPASHGCIRIAPENAAALYEMVRAEGARIVIQGDGTMGETRFASRQERRLARIAMRARAAERARALASEGDIDPMMPLGYAPAAPDVVRWMTDPAGY